MGYDTGRIKGEVDEELVCPICTGVLEDPVQADKCEHSFCRGCIRDWLAKNSSCPIDRGELTERLLKPVPRILKNLLSRLQISCEYRDEGCKKWIKLDAFDHHLKVCDFNPKKAVQCDKGCRLMHMKCETETHDCIKELRFHLDQSRQQKQELEDSLTLENERLNLEIVDLQRELSQLREELQRLKAAIKPPNPDPWFIGLPNAKVSRWGGLISTPDAVLQTITKKRLIEFGCSLNEANLLVTQSHEKEWPLDLKDLESRRINRGMLETYNTRRIPGDQAVVVMACENMHISPNLMLHPGMIFHFAQGVEEI